MKHRKKNQRFPLLSYISYFIFHISFLFSPLSAAANGVEPFTSAKLLNAISVNIINPMIFALFAIAFVVFLWGLVQFLGSLDNEEARSTGVKHMIWGIIGMVIMISANGIITIINNTVKSIGGGP